MYKCPLHWITGFPCPGCGMTRALACLLQGDISGAFTMHPLIFAVPVLLVLLILGSRKIRKYTAIITVTAFLAVYIARMVMYYPNSEPMLYNSESFFAGILDIIIR